jgi:hypothetical protein
MEKAITTNKFATEVKASIVNPSHEPESTDLGHFTFRDRVVLSVPQRCGKYQIKLAVKVASNIL